MSQPTRSILKVILTNFVNSFRPRQIRGTLIGSDYFGNKYYEIPANPQLGKRKPSRWFEPVEKEDFEQEMPAEWEAWLRGRRSAPPSDQEVMKNYAIMQLKKKNAAELDEKHARDRDRDLHGQLAREARGPDSFPKYDDYEVIPGKPRK